jgi:hypothetical protein
MITRRHNAHAELGVLASPSFVKEEMTRGTPVNRLSLLQAASSAKRMASRCLVVLSAGAIWLWMSSLAFASGSDSSADLSRHPVRLTVEFPLRPANAAILDWIKQGDWCWGIASRPEIPDEMLVELKRRNLRAVVTVLAHPESRRRQWSDEWKLAVPDIPTVIARYRKLMGTNFAWEAFTEDDSMGVGFSKDLLRAQPRSHQAAHGLFSNYLAKAMEEVRPHADVERWGRCGYASSAHPMAALGLDCVLVERANDDIEDLQTAIAFDRGAARQHGCQWGVDFSLWWGVIHGCVQNLPASFHKRNFYLSYFSGANVLAVEGGDFLVQLPNLRATLLGQALDDFGRFTRRVLPGVPDVPVAVMIPEDHGWITPPYWRTGSESWNYARIPYRPGDASLDGFFGAAFPGATFAMDPFPFGAYETNDPPASPFSLSAVTPQYAPLPENVFAAQPPIPFGRFNIRHEARRALEAQQVDPSPWRPLGDSRWGNIVDALTVGASLDVLQQYRIVVLLGPVNLDDSLRRTLLDYVRSGGTLIAAAGVLGPSDRDWCGVTMEAELRVGRAWRWGDDAPVNEPFRYLPSRPAKGSEVLARTPGGDPLVVRHSLGGGKVYVSLLPWFGSGDSSWAKLSLRLADEVIRPVQPALVEGLPVEWLSAHDADHRTVVIANHDGQPWCGTVTLRAVPAEFRECRELLTGRILKSHRKAGDRSCIVEVPPYDVRVIRYARSSS